MRKLVTNLRSSFRQRVAICVVVAIALLNLQPAVAAQSPNGDVDCSTTLTSHDARVIIEGLVGLRTVVSGCPLAEPRTSGNLDLADYDNSGVVTVRDALLLAKCCGNALDSRSNTLPPGASLPSGQSCASRVHPTAENVPENAPWNSLVGVSVDGTTYLSSNINAASFEARIDGDFVGTTDEIIQWASCKWGFDEDHVRSQALLESSWFAGKLGDCGQTTVPETTGCASVGIYQVRGAEIAAVHPGTMPWAWDSTAFNLDYSLAVHRACFEGLEPWLAGESPNGVPYAAGDFLGCSGRWFSGDWYSEGATAYMGALQDAIEQFAWRKDATGCPNWEANGWCQ